MFKYFIFFISDFMKIKKRRLFDDSSDDERPAKRPAH